MPGQFSGHPNARFVEMTDWRRQEVALNLRPGGFHAVPPALIRPNEGLVVDRLAKQIREEAVDCIERQEVLVVEQRRQRLDASSVGGGGACTSVGNVPMCSAPQTGH